MERRDSRPKFVRPTLESLKLNQYSDLMRRSHSKHSVSARASASTKRYMANASLEDLVEEFKNVKMHEYCNSESTLGESRSSTFVREKFSEQDGHINLGYIHSIVRRFTRPSADTVKSRREPSHPRDGKSADDLNPAERRSHVLELASRCVDDIIEDSFKQLGLNAEEAEEASPEVHQRSVQLLKSFLQKTEEAEQERPSLFELANDFIDDLLDESNRRTQKLKLIGIERFQKYKSPEEFTVKDSLEIIARCVDKWTFNPNWYYRTLSHGKMESETSRSFFYSIKWSVPTPGYPVAQVTVDVNFTIEVFSMRPPPIHIDVWFRVETDRSQRCAFTTEFQEKWIQDVVNRKLQAFQLFTF